MLKDLASDHFESIESLLYFANWPDAILRRPPVLEHYIGNHYCLSTVTCIDLIMRCYAKNMKTPLTSSPPFSSEEMLQLPGTME